MRVQVSLSDEIVRRLDNYSNLIGVPRSALCSVFIAEGVLEYDNAFNLFDDSVDYGLIEG